VTIGGRHGYMFIQPSPETNLECFLNSVRDVIDLTAEEPRGSRGNPIYLTADNAENQATEANQITQQEREMPQKEVFEEQESAHQKMTKMTTMRLEILLEKVQSGGWVGAEDDEEFYVDKDTGESRPLKPIYVANVGEDIKSITIAAYKTTSNAGGSLMASQWMCQKLVRFCKERSCIFPTAYGALVFYRFEWDAAVETFPNGARSDDM
jgi:hypothetical protein